MRAVAGQRRPRRNADRLALVGRGRGPAPAAEQRGRGILPPRRRAAQVSGDIALDPRQGRARQPPLRRTATFVALRQRPLHLVARREPRSLRRPLALAQVHLPLFFDRVASLVLLIASPSLAQLK